MSPFRRLTLLPAATLALLGLAPAQAERPSIPTVPQVELQRFMGNWYVIANIPPWIEKEAHNSVENYRLDEKGRVATVFTYRKGGFDAPVKTLESIGHVRPTGGNAVWDVEFLWPFKAEYLIAHLAPDYSKVIVARSKRDYVWIMARTPQIADAEYQDLLQRVAALGYDMSKLNKVPQRWPDPGRELPP